MIVIKVRAQFKMPKYSWYKHASCHDQTVFIVIISLSQMMGHCLLLCAKKIELPIYLYKYFKLVLHLREHVLLSAFRVYLVLHEHMKLPLVFVQFCAQPPLLVRHSLVSLVRLGGRRFTNS